MTRVSGDLKIVTEDPSTVRHIQIRARKPRPHGTGMITAEPSRIPVDDGRIEFNAAPGPVTIILERARGSESFEGVVPEKEATTLRRVLEAVIEYDPPVVHDAQSARDDAESAALRTADDRRQTGEDRVATGEDRKAAEKDAERSAEEAALAKGERESAENAAESAWDAAGSSAAETAALIRDEMDDRVSEAGQHAQASGASATAAGQAEARAKGHADDAVSAEAAIRTTHIPEIQQLKESTAADRVAVGQDRAAVTDIRQDVEEHRGDIIDAADRIGSAQQVEQWYDGTKAAATRAETAAGTVETVVDNAAEVLEQRVGDGIGRAESAATKAEGHEAGAAAAAAAEVEKLKGDAPEAFDTLEEIADELARNETERAALANSIGEKARREEVDTALAGKANAEHEHELRDIPDLPPIAQHSTANSIVQRWNDGTAWMGDPDPESPEDAVNVRYVESRLTTRTTPEQVENQITAARLPGRWFSGDGPSPPAADIGAIPGDFYLDESAMEVHKYEEES